MSTPDRDEAFEKFLADRALLPHALQQREQDEPPAELDRLVMQKARAAVEPSAAGKMLQRNRWFVPLTLAATVVLSFTIVLKIRQENGNAPFTPMSARVIDAASDSGRPVPMEPRLREVPEQALRRDYEIRPLESAPAAASSADSAAGASAPPVSEEIHGAPQEAEAAALESYAAETERAASATESSQALAAKQRWSAPRAAAKATLSDSVANEAPRESRSEAVAAVAPAPPPAAAPMEGQDANRIETPQAWLERIARLRAEGKTAEAEREWQAFRNRYPDRVTDGLATENPVRQ